MYFKHFFQQDKKFSLLHGCVLIPEIVGGGGGFLFMGTMFSEQKELHNPTYCPAVLSELHFSIVIPAPPLPPPDPEKNGPIFYQGKKRRLLVCVWKQWKNYWAIYKLCTCGINLIFHWMVQKCIQIMQFWNAKLWNLFLNRKLFEIVYLMNIPFVNLNNKLFIIIHKQS